MCSSDLNINNNEVINKTQDEEKSPNNETSQVKETPKETNRKVRLNVTPQVQKVWYYCAPTSVRWRGTVLGCAAAA